MSAHSSRLWRSGLPHPNSGLSLVETMISLVLLGTLLLGIASIAANVGKSLNSAYRRSQAVSVARQHLEYELARPYDEIADGTSEYQGISMTRKVTATPTAKEIALAYNYSLRGETRQDTIVAAAGSR